VRRFERSEEGAGCERLRAFTEALWDALVKEGECASVQGELIRANSLLQTAYFRDGMGNYYCKDNDGQTLADTFYGARVVFVLDTMVKNRNRALCDEDAAYFARVRQLVEPDWVRRQRIEQLENNDDASDSDRKELDELEDEDRDRGVWWEELFDRAERCIANWCIANPGLIDRQDRPIQEGGVRDRTDVIEPPGGPPPTTG
jgi:hypothetical protein